MQTLHITSLRDGFRPEQTAGTPLADGVFAVQLAVAGTPVGPYRD